MPHMVAQVCKAVPMPPAGPQGHPALIWTQEVQDYLLTKGALHCSQLITTGLGLWFVTIEFSSAQEKASAYLDLVWANRMPGSGAQEQVHKDSL